MGLVVGIDASRNRSGGAQAHIIGILSECDPAKSGIEKIHIWAFKSLLDRLPNFSWLIKHNPPELQQGLFKQLAWQAFSLSREAKLLGCNIIFATDASTLSRFKPLIVLSQDMLSYEPGIMRYFGYSFFRLRLLAILVIQNLAFRRANGVIFLTRYAARLIQYSCGKIQNYKCIPHGVDPIFRRLKLSDDFPRNKTDPIRTVYVSNTEMYKHQWVVVKAISTLRNRGYNLHCSFVGGGKGRSLKLLQESISKLDPKGIFIKQLSFLAHNKLPKLLQDMDLYIFASSCENMPVTLIEGMASGLPIACSNRGPMPEVLEDGGVFFDPENSDSIANAIEQILLSPELRSKITKRAINLSHQFTWQRCSYETLEFIAKTYFSAKQ